MVFLPCVAIPVIVTSEISLASDGEDKWRIYSKEPNGDIYFFNPSRVNKVDNLHRVWSRVRYKTSVMGAQSYQSLLEIDCTEQTDKILQNTFFSDKNWERPAISTDKTEKPKRPIVKDSAGWRLSKILCDQ